MPKYWIADRGSSCPDGYGVIDSYSQCKEACVDLGLGQWVGSRTQSNYQFGCIENTLYCYFNHAVTDSNSQQRSRVCVEVTTAVTTNLETMTTLLPTKLPTTPSPTFGPTPSPTFGPTTSPPSGCKNHHYYTDSQCNSWKDYCPGGTILGYEGWMEHYCCEACMDTETESLQQQQTRNLSLDMIKTSSAGMILNGLAVLGVLSILRLVFGSQNHFKPIQTEEV